MCRVNLKSGVVIIIYSLLLSLVIGLGMYSIKGSFNNLEGKVNQNNVKVIMFKNDVNNQDDSIYGSLNENEFPPQNFNKVVRIDEIGKVYLNSGFKDILIMVILFFTIFIIASFLLWVTLNKIHNKEIENIVKKLNTIDDDFNPYLVSKSFGIAYENIKEKFKQNLEDYKKLNSYLSHEQKNAIAILRTNLEVDENKKYIKLLDNITNSIDDILTLSDLKSGDEMVLVDVSLVCANICDTYRKAYKNIEFDFDDNTTILAKERWIYRAVSNLIDNAVKYGGDNPIKVSVKNRYNSVVIEVKDNGIGMDKNFIEKIFNNKYRINDLNKDGYGIGLSLVSHVCDLCNGVVLVDSEINKGSCFYLSFSEYKG
ncbi:sensor histidine kinase [Clostridium weizhouense]|uniref:histidine kinase n=1 Tax=Clostridium weizhouense TaxID=2859781 RepID=A0ABS7AQS8_9CLOT|nr:HAMP domain-containing sensor histidine kinase [Clostridium weizhouense]MBW6410999.1 HAMP domain-containing histidine kinase [Clostridium weizhouense]